MHFFLRFRRLPPPGKQNKIKYTAELYLSEKDINDLQPRFDVSEIFVKNNKVDKINYIENAF